MSITITQALQEAREVELPSESASLDAQVLLADILQQPRAWLLAHPEAELSDEQEAEWDAKLVRLAKGEPLPYIIGRWEFFGLEFKVTPDVLIPRPETELLVETALDWLKANPTKKRIVDVGTGSGCIAVAVAVAVNVSDAAGNDVSGGRTAVRPYTEIVAVDVSEQALEVARGNALAHKVDKQISFVQSDLLGEVKGAFDLLCANLPYIPSDTFPALDVYKHEPALALDGGTDGLELIERLLANAPRVLNAGALLLLEIEENQGEGASKLAKKHYPNADIVVLPDLAGKPRLLRIQT